MKKHFAAAMLAASMLAAPAAIMTSTATNAATCGVDAPAEWERPGGFCEQLRSTKSLSDTSDAAECEEIWSFELDLLKDLQIGESVLVAASKEECDPEY